MRTNQHGTMSISSEQRGTMSISSACTKNQDQPCTMSITLNEQKEYVMGITGGADDDMAINGCADDDDVSHTSHSKEGAEDCSDNGRDSEAEILSTISLEGAVQRSEEEKGLEMEINGSRLGEKEEGSPDDVNEDVALANHLKR